MNLIVRDMDTPEHCTTPQDEVPQSLAFTVTFGEAKKKHFKRHSRNLSLPVVKVYDNNAIPGAVNGAKKPGNHSEGYFSSDPEDENGHLRKAQGAVAFPDPKDELIEENNLGACGQDDEGSDALSETGTYTIDKETPEVVTARLSIDASFGIDNKISTSRDSAAWISEWASNTVNHHNSFKGSTSSLLGPTVAKTKMTISKIPSPISARARLGTRKTKKNETEPYCKSESGENSYETESYLKTTEKALSAIAARMSVSLDSGGESDADSKSSGNKKGLHRSDSSASESGPKPQTPSATRYNRAFSLRRGRLDAEETKKTDPPVASLGPARGATPKSEHPPHRSTSSVRSKATTPILPPPGLSRNDNSRLSVRSKLSPQSPLLSTPKNGMVSTKKVSPGAYGPGGGNSGGGGRSNSTLSSKEVEFQNWKRRKNYDPMKAAAEGKKKDAAAKKPIAVPSTPAGNEPLRQDPVSVSSPKSTATSVLRSASFHGHGTRQSLATGPSSSDDEEEEITLSAEEEEWPNPPQAPKGVDNLVVSAISGISNKLRVNASTLLKKLRYLYDEENDKYKCLTNELEQLELLGETTGSPQKSSSRELALTLKNLKRLDTTLKVLNDVLFDNVDYE
uniref:CEP170 C-terminal domain-containing protein n=1 Tax=Lygus hesperus TaxID=30085 RepID=A0A146L802_LYGHE